MWILRTGAPWKDLPPRYPLYQTCHRRFKSWCRHGTLEKVLHASPSPAEVTLVDETLDSGFLDEEPERLIGDKAHDSDPLDQHLLETH